jgi:hypothetical protein
MTNPTAPSAVEDPNCAICHVPYGTPNEGNDIESPVQSPCGHTFGHLCIRIWILFNQKSCPLCRHNLSGWKPPRPANLSVNEKLEVRFNTVFYTALKLLRADRRQIFARGEFMQDMIHDTFNWLMCRVGEYRDPRVRAFYLALKFAVTMYDRGDDEDRIIREFCAQIIEDVLPERPESVETRYTGGRSRFRDRHDHR